MQRVGEVPRSVPGEMLTGLLMGREDGPVVPSSAVRNPGVVPKSHRLPKTFRVFLMCNIFPTKGLYIKLKLPVFQVSS